MCVVDDAKYSENRCSVVSRDPASDMLNYPPAASSDTSLHYGHWPLHVLKLLCHDGSVVLVCVFALERF